MKIGVFIFSTAYAMPIDELAVAMEERGFDSLFLPEHTHIPACRRSPWPGGPELPLHYKSTLDPFVALATAAAVTKTLRLGTGICLVSQRDPIITAKEVATLDLVSGGRAEFGIGAGWNAEEMENHGTVFEDRFRLMVDRVKAMKVIWSEEEASYQGDFVQFDKLWSWPKPLQKPNPPILLGGETKYTLRRVVDFCDGWFPRPRGFQDPKARMAEFRQVAEDAGRDFRTLSTTLFGAEANGDYLKTCEEAGVDRVLFPLPSEGREKVLPLLDDFAQFIRGSA
jgi:probable F420-dependent oxidoreductase